MGVVWINLHLDRFSWDKWVEIASEQFGMSLVPVLSSWVPQDSNREETPEKFPNFVKLMLKHRGGSTEERKFLRTDLG